MGAVVSGIAVQKPDPVEAQMADEEGGNPAVAAPYGDGNDHDDQMLAALDKMCVPLTMVALILARAPFLAAGKPLAGAAWETAAEQHLRETVFNISNHINFAMSIMYIVMLMWLHVKGMTASPRRPTARRTLAAVAAMFTDVFLSKAMAYSVQCTNNITQAAVAFLAAVGFMAVVVVWILYKLKILVRICGKTL